MNEKGLIVHLHTLLGTVGKEWRDDTISHEANGAYFALSIDHPEPIGLFSEDVTPMRHYGRWSAGVVANDLWASGISPQRIAFDFGLRGHDVVSIENWVAGVLDICQEYGMAYSGGNLNRTGATCSGVCWAHSDLPPVHRGGAVPGDVIVVTAELGTGWAIRLLSDSGFEAEIPREVADYKLMPCIKPALFREVFRRKLVNSCMDLTDGLFEFCSEIAERGNVSVMLSRIEPPLVVSRACSLLGLPTVSFMFELGYDTPYAHGWAISPDNLKSVESLLKEHHQAYRIVGVVTQKMEHPVVFDAGSSIHPVPAIWDDVLDRRGSVEKWRTDVVEVVKDWA